MRPITRHQWRYGILQTIALIATAGFVEAQAPGTGAIAGRVFDPSRAVVADAHVSVVSEGTNWSRAATTSAEGLFQVPLLPPAGYFVVVDAAGFKRKILRSVHVVVSETVVVDVELEVGAATAQVEVTGLPELAQTESSALGRVTDENTIVSLPLANRNFTQILALNPGVVVGLPNAGDLGKANQNVSTNGAKTTSNNFQFNGIDANNLSENSASGYQAEIGIAIPAPDTIEEFKVQTGMYDAGYGRGAGANVDIVSKAGSNTFRGNLWEFFRNDTLNANDFFLKRNGQPRPVLKQNQFGGAIGGPIQKDKTFFFASYQGTIQRNGIASGAEATAFLPPLTGDRSAAALGQLFGGQTGASGGSSSIALDGSNINPVALALLNFKLANGGFAIPTPQTILREVGEEEKTRMRAHLAKLMPDAAGQVISVSTCMYTNTPDYHFIIDRHPVHERVVFACGFSGHGFKFGSVVGEVLADLALQGHTAQPIELFALSRVRSAVR